MPKGVIGLSERELRWFTQDVKRLVALAREYQAHVDAGALLDVEEEDPKLRQRIEKALAPFQTW